MLWHNSATTAWAYLAGNEIKLTFRSLAKDIFVPLKHLLDNLRVKLLEERHDEKVVFTEVRSQ